MLSKALSLHQKGELSAARALYERVLAADPDNHEALHLMGALSLQSGDPATAESLIAKAITLHPTAEIYYGNRANALRQLERIDEALACLDAAIAINPDFAESHYQQGVLLAEQKRYAEAVAAFERAVARNPRHAQAHYNKGNAQLALRDHAGALESYDAAIALRPNYAKAFYNKGTVWRELKNDAAAIDCFTQAIALDPGYAKAYYNRGNALQAQKRHAEAVRDYDHCITLRPDDDLALVNKGNALLSQREYASALTAYERAIAVSPAVAAYHNNKGNAHLGLHDTGGALDAYGRALAVDPLEKDAHFNQAICRLLLGDLPRGFAQYEWRWQTEDMAAHAPRFAQPRWTGREALDGKRILLHCEQGFGDTIQFVRYASLVRDRGAQVVLAVQPPLIELMKGLAGGGELVADGSPLPAFDFHCPLLSLPLACGTTLDTIPAPSRYIAADAAKVAAWQRRLGPRARPRVGLAWSGRPEHKNDENRSLPLADFLRALPAGLDLVCLQKEIRARDRELLAARPDIRVFAADLNDFSDTAALCETLDLVVSVDTSVAHLAGALGKPAWILLPFVPDWRWLLERDDSPWYPNARLFRQPEAGDWDGALARLRTALAQHFPHAAASGAEVTAQARQDADRQFKEGVSQRRRGNPAAAVACYDRALALDPRHARAAFNRGNALMELRQVEAAAASYRLATELEPGAVDAHFNLGTALLALTRTEAAVAAFDRALALKPDSVDALVNKGNALRDLGREEEAIAAYDRAIAADPGRAEACNNKAAALLALGRPAEAVPCFDAAIARRPREAAFHLGKAGALRQQGKLAAALETFDRAMDLAPDEVDVRTGRALCLLLAGRLEQGFAEYEWRWRSADLAASRPRYAQPLWLGREPIAGKRVLLRWEQGLGDTIQFVRYARVLAERGAHVILVVQRPLQALMASLDARIDIVADGDALPAFDFHCPLLSLPLACGTTLDTIPAPRRYLAAAADKLEAWRARLGRQTGPRLGLAWSGRPEHKHDAQRSMALAAFLEALPAGFELVALQKDIRAADRAALEADPRVRHFGEALNDFADTAALTELMDLVISVDTSVAHLAGALGKPAWVLLPFVPDWRWLTERADSPWYPGARLFRQARPGDWAGVLDKVRDGLEEMTVEGFRRALARGSAPQE